MDNDEKLFFWGETSPTREGFGHPKILIAAKGTATLNSVVVHFQRRFV